MSENKEELKSLLMRVWERKKRVKKMAYNSIFKKQRSCMWSHSVQFSSVQFSHSVVSDSLWPYESQHIRHPCPSPTPGVYSNSCPLSQWCHPATSSFVFPFSSCPQSLPALGSFPMSQLFTWGGHSIGVSSSASVLPMNPHYFMANRWGKNGNNDGFYCLGLQRHYRQWLKSQN